MRLRCRISSLPIISGLAAFLMLNVTAFSQTPERVKPTEADPASVNLRALEGQVRELSAALEEMRAEIKEARSEATELKHELKSATDQLHAIQSVTASNPGQAMAAPTSPPPAPASTQVQELDGRTANLEEEQQLLSAKVDDQYQTKVESGSKYRVKLSGMAVFNAFTTRGTTDNFDLPGIAVAQDPGEPGSFGATLRQSMLGLDVFGPEIAGAKTSGDIRVDFFGGFSRVPDGTTSDLVRLRTAGFRLDWQQTSVVAGQYGPFFSPLSPTSLASLAYPALADSGNLWRWTPEMYVEHRMTLANGSDVTFQGGIMDALTGEVPPYSAYRIAQAGESGGQPAYAARIAWGRGPHEPLSFGAGGYYARQNWGGHIVDAWAGTADWMLPMSHGFSLTGEFYRGRAIGGLGAAEGQSIVFAGSQLYGAGTRIEGLNSTGGWAQLKFMPAERIEFNGAWGEDFSPTPPYYSQSYDGLAAGRNQSAFLNTIYHARSNIMFSLEYRRLWTAENDPTRSKANQVSLSAATLF